MKGDLPPGIESPPTQKSPPVSYSSPPTSGLPLPPPSMTIHPTTNANRLAEAASKISLLSPDQFQLPFPTRLEIVQTVSGNSSPSREEVANILKEDSPTTDRTFKGIGSAPSPTSVKLSHSAVFSTPPAVPQQAMALPTEMDSVGLAIMRQIKQERDVQAVDIAGKCNDENDGPDGTEAGQGGQARQGRKEQTDMVVSALTGSITKRMEQIVSQEMKKMLPGLVSRGMEGMERDMVNKLGGLEKEAIGLAVANGVTEIVDGSYRQAFGQQAAGFERAMGSMLQQISEEFMAGRRMEVENVGVLDKLVLLPTPGKG